MAITTWQWFANASGKETDAPNIDLDRDSYSFDSVHYCRRVNWTRQRRTWPTRRSTHNVAGVFSGGGCHDSSEFAAGHRRQNTGFLLCPRSDAFAARYSDRHGFYRGWRYFET